VVLTEFEILIPFPEHVLYLTTICEIFTTAVVTPIPLNSDKNSSDSAPNEEVTDRHDEIPINV